MINKALKTLYIYNGVFVLAGGLFGPLYAVYVQKLGGDILVISLSWSVFLITSTFFIFLVARFGDRIHDRKNLLLIGILIRAATWLLYIFVDSMVFLIILQVLLGLGEALGSPTYDAMVAEHLDSGRHMEEYSDMKIIFNLCGAFSIIVGGIIAEQFGFTYLFLTMSFLALVSFLGIYSKPKNFFNILQE